MIWKGREIHSVGDLIVAMERLEDPGEARAFKHAYIQAERALGTEDPIKLVNENLGYCTGYLSRGDMVRLQEWLDVEWHCPDSLLGGQS